MSMTPTRLVDARHISILDTLKRLREARADGDPSHDPLKCSGPCWICAMERSLNRQLDKLNRRQEWS